MKHKQKQWIKGLMLSTALGLGVSVAGDISHAAGNEGSQMQIVNEWNKNKLYDKNDIVTYEGVQYKPLTLTCVDRPNVTPSQWEVVKVDDRKNADGIKEWKQQQMYYNIGTIVTYKGVQYEKVSHSYNDSEPGTNDQSWKKVEELKADEGIVYKEPMYENSESYFRLKNGTANSLASYGMESTNPYHARYIKFVENGWNTIRGKKCYVENNQWVVDTVKVIDGIEYFFAENGVATEVK